MDANTLRRTQPVESQGHVDLRVDVGHADQPEGKSLAAGWLRDVVMPMQGDRLFPYPGSHLGIQGVLWLV